MDDVDMCIYVACVCMRVCLYAYVRVGLGDITIIITTNILIIDVKAAECQSIEIVNVAVFH